MLPRSILLKQTVSYAFLFTVLVLANSVANPANALELKKVVDGLESPTAIVHAGDERLFVLEQSGRIRIIENGRLLSTPFLDISDIIESGGEQGLLGIAFHPDYVRADAPGAGWFWLNYTDRNGDTVVSRYRVQADHRNRADAGSARILFKISQPYANHNGGQLQFGPPEGRESKRYLYIGMGDGGLAGDPHNNAQNDASALGKMLRLDPSLEPNPALVAYQIPEENPKADADYPQNIIWAKGLRNPWRFSFDRATGDLYIADVGQNRWEEINMTPLGTPGGVNYGWPILEGDHCFKPPLACQRKGLTRPVFEYASGGGRCAVIGGYVYRGRRLKELAGTYIYADYCSGEVFGLEQVEPGRWQGRMLLDTDSRPTSFGEGNDGELYLVTGDGAVYVFH